MSAPSVKAKKESDLEKIFNGLAETWRKETGGYALTQRRYAHHSYQTILTLGKDAIPLILCEMQQRPDRWFEALKALTKGMENPAQNAKTFNEAVSCWIEWGKDRRLI